MIFNILTLFPEIFEGPFSESIVKRAQEKGLIKINIFNLRDWGIGKHKQIDDNPYGGGVGMVMRVDVVGRAISNIKLKTQSPKRKVVLLTPQGKRFNQKVAESLTKNDEITLICGHYEGFDERVRELVDEEISIGDYILTGGEIPAMVVVDTVSRLIPGVLRKQESTQFESFSMKTPDSKSQTPYFLEYPQYTRPDNYKGKKVPEVLLSGNHAKIEKWRSEEAIKRTKKRRPDLLKK